ncbi:hypothetical protein F511_10984 [Dorcoceras hygrometricum]|uniref:EF-hand domain-containing protein n=1 Tax=Dorcoceras hygrometricum TaxID=472368 RepID=A0A2Z7CQI4_9LAMI|nr:hypothetical protein F511_10984 [Dorcoceras hygrometricum]
MPETKLSKGKSLEAIASEEESENENGKENMIQYERERLKRIEENKRRMEALGLHKMASSFMSSVQKAHKKQNDRKGKKKMVDEDEEYKPTEEEQSSSGEEDEEFSGSGKKKGKRSASTRKKYGSVKKLTFTSDFVDDDDLMQAIALSLQDSAGFLDVKTNCPPQSSGANLRDSSAATASGTTFIDSSDKRKENLYVPDDSRKRKRKEPITRRTQMSEDELLIHFFQFDETGNEGFFLRDLRRLAAAHDFTWSEKEMADMIHLFDSDGDGKITLDDFRKIVCRCNMLKGTDQVMNGTMSLHSNAAT